MPETLFAAMDAAAAQRRPRGAWRPKLCLTSVLLAEQRLERSSSEKRQSARIRGFPLSSSWTRLAAQTLLIFWLWLCPHSESAHIRPHIRPHIRSDRIGQTAAADSGSSQQEDDESDHENGS